MYTDETERKLGRLAEVMRPESGEEAKAMPKAA